MPHQTFFNIAEDKRQALIDTALLEFALNDYQSASVSRMVKDLGIAKGSIYQYFANKRDLYFFLIDLAEKKRKDAITPFLTKRENNFFKWFEQVYVAAIRFDLKNLPYSCFLNSVSLEQNTQEVGDLASRHRKVEMQLLAKSLKKRHKKSNLRTDIDIDLQAYWLAQVIQNIPFLLQMQFGIDMTDALRKGETRVKLSKADLNTLMGHISQMAKSGLRKSK